MSRCDAKMVGEEMKNVKKLEIMTLVIILATTSLAFSCQAGGGVSGTADPNQLSIQAPKEVPEHYSFQIIVTAGNNPIPGAIVTVSWLATGFITDKNGAVTLMSPWVDHDTQFTIMASKKGYLSGKALITVINLPIP